MPRKPAHEVGLAREIAKRVGVSIMTVSRVIRTPDLVAPGTRHKVEAAIREFDYRPSEVARRLATGRANTVGFATPITWGVFGEFFSVLFQGLEEILADLGTHVLLMAARGEPISSLAATVRQGLADGLIIYQPSPDDASLGPPLLAKCPAVFLLGRNPAAETDCILVDNAKGVRLAMEHLHRLGHRRIAHITGPRYAADGLEREAAYRRLVGELGCDAREDYIVPGEFNVSGGYNAMERLLALPSRPTAVFAANDGTALGAMRAIHHHGLRVPEHISLIGFDDLPFCDMVNPRLTTIASPVRAAGRQAGEILLERIEAHASGSEQTLLPRTRVLEPSLVEGESCAPPPHRPHRH